MIYSCLYIIPKYLNIFIYNKYNIIHHSNHSYHCYLYVIISYEYADHYMLLLYVVIIYYCISHHMNAFPGELLLARLKGKGFSDGHPLAFSVRLGNGPGLLAFFPQGNTPPKIHQEPSDGFWEIFDRV